MITFYISPEDQIRAETRAAALDVHKSHPPGQPPFVWDNRLACVNRPLRYATSFFGVVVLLSILPTYLAVLFPEAQAFGDVRIQLRGRQVFRGGVEVRLTRKEFDLLRYLVEHRGEVITRDRLLDEVWGYDHFPTTRTVDTHVLRLRQKFERDPERPRHIVTAHGQGYRFIA